MSWTYTFHQAPEAALQLLCFAYAGGSTRLYHPWGPALAPQIEVTVVNLPGRERRLGEPPIAAMDTLIPQLAAGVLPVLNRPFACFGHSLGALIAYELACYLRDHGHPQPRHLFVSGRPAPDYISPLSPLHPLPDDAFVAEVQRRYGGIPPQVVQERELLQMLLPALRADLQLAETYQHRPRPGLDCPVSALTGAADPLASERQMAGWSACTARGFEQRLIPGDHFFVQNHAASVIEFVRSRLLDPRESVCDV